MKDETNPPETAGSSFILSMRIAIVHDLMLAVEAMHRDPAS